MTWILTAIALIGAMLNSERKKEGFYYWVVSNSGFCVYNFCIHEYAMSFLFGIYLLITINGLRTWK